MCKAQRKQDLPVLVAVTARSVRRVSLQPLVQHARPGHKLGDRGSGDLLIRNQAVAIGVHGAFVGAAQTDDGSRYFPSLQVGVLFHARLVLVIIDEAGGVPKSIFDAVDALATNIDARAVAVGNPDDPGSHFATICKPGSGWHVETISAFDTPAYTGEKVPEDLLPLLVSPEWVEERKLRWGVTSPIYQSKVLGEFPDLSDDTLILPKLIEAAQMRTLERNRRPIIAADIARFGEDETVIMRREGGWIRVYRAHHKADTMTTTGHIAKAMRDIDAETDKNDWVRAIVDVPGVGGGVVDRLAELELPVVPYNGGEAPIDKERFVNARAEDYWTLRERFEKGEIDIDPDDDKLAAQLGSIKWGIDSRGRIKIESKDDMRKTWAPVTGQG
jgi:hypothetical protein